MFFVILPFTGVFVPIGKGIGALPVEIAILKFTDVFIPIGKGIGAYAIVPTSRRPTDCWTDPPSTFIVARADYRVDILTPPHSQEKDGG